MAIDSRAIVSPKAELAEGVTVGPYSVIEDGVKIGKGTWIGPHAVIKGPTTIGEGNKIFQFASIGDAPQDIRAAQENGIQSISVRTGVTPEGHLEACNPDFLLPDLTHLDLAILRR